MRKRYRLISFAIAFALVQVSLASAQEKSILVASTTSTEDSGLFRFILPCSSKRPASTLKSLQGALAGLSTSRAAAMPT